MSLGRSKSKVKQLTSCLLTLTSLKDFCLFTCVLFSPVDTLLSVSSLASISPLVSTQIREEGRKKSPNKILSDQSRAKSRSGLRVEVSLGWWGGGGGSSFLFSSSC